MATRVKALVIRPDDTYEVQEISVSLGVMQQIVGGLLEGVALDGGAYCYCNEEGKLRGLPVNRLATALAWTLGFRTDDQLVGDVLVVGLGDGENETDVPTGVVDQCAALAAA